VQTGKTREQDQECSNAALYLVAVCPAQPLLVICGVVRCVATADEEADNQEHRKRDARQSQEPL
jgi:hypothetical protein